MDIQIQRKRMLRQRCTLIIRRWDEHGWIVPSRLADGPVHRKPGERSRSTTWSSRMVWAGVLLVRVTDALSRSFWSAPLNCLELSIAHTRPAPSHTGTRPWKREKQSENKKLNFNVFVFDNGKFCQLCVASQPCRVKKKRTGRPRRAQPRRPASFCFFPWLPHSFFSRWCFEGIRKDGKK